MSSETSVNEQDVLLFILSKCDSLGYLAASLEDEKVSSNLTAFFKKLKDNNLDNKLPQCSTNIKKGVKYVVDYLLNVTGAFMVSNLRSQHCEDARPLDESLELLLLETQISDPKLIRLI